MEYEPGYYPGYYDVVINEVHAVLTRHEPLVNPDALYVTATTVVEQLVEENLIRPLEKCEYANGPKTVVCENLAPLTKSWCFDHGNY